MKMKIHRPGGIRTPTVFQMEAAECGAASLLMILRYYGCHISMEEMRIACGVSRNGCTAAGIVTAAREFGLRSSGYRVSADKLENLPLPCVLHWNGDHFVVLDKVGRKKNWINDPANGRLSVTREELAAQYTGIENLLELFYEHKQSLKKEEKTMKWTQEKLEKLYQEINRLAREDPEFVKAFQADPYGVMERVAGAKLPEGFKLDFVDGETAHANAYTLPNFTGDEVDLNSLTGVSGGVSIFLIFSACAADGGCGARGCGGDACGAHGGCAADGCGGDACGAAGGCVAAACGGAACGAAGPCLAAASGASACGAAGGCVAAACGGAAAFCVGDACGGAACGAAAPCVTNVTGIGVCGADAGCGAATCATALCTANVFCGADVCGAATGGTDGTCGAAVCGAESDPWYCDSLIG